MQNKHYDFEHLIIQVEYLYSAWSPSHKPHEMKQKAIDLLNQHKEKTKEYHLLGIINYYLGLNYLDIEDNSQSRKHMSQSLNDFSKVQNIYPYLQYVQGIYNHLGYFAINSDKNEDGIALLAKAEELGLFLMKQNFQTKFKYQGGFQKVSDHYTITLFYLAQAYTKLGVKDKAAFYCGQTMLRQYKTKTFELKDICVNCISLSEYYSGIGFFSQAFYLLQIGESLLPAGRKHKFRATFHMTQGKVISEFLVYSVAKLKSKIHEDPTILMVINKQVLDFELNDVKFIKFKNAQNYEEVKSQFRQANTLYKKALSYFVLDGFVSEHLQILHDQSHMYKQLTYLEKDINNVIALVEKRRDLLTPIINQINHKAYQNYYEKLLVELAEINNELYDLIHSFNSIDDMTSKNKKLTEKMNTAALLTIDGYKQIIKQLELLDAKERDQSWYQSIVTGQFNIAKAYSKIQPKEKKQKVEYLVQSLQVYRNLLKYIKQEANQFEFYQEARICQEMIELLPTKIDKINYS
ncbi:hypothetical protein pb186bvf_020170 [Paramecium bursaria]